MQETFDPRLAATVAAQPYPLLFVTISGAHLYGFPSPDSDYDLRGAHLLPLPALLRLTPGEATIGATTVVDGLEIDLVSHDIHKFFSLLLKKNGYVLEQVLSPLVLHSTPGHAELVALAPGCVTRYHSHHYLGFAATQWRFFERSGRVKPLLYTYRTLLTGIHLMQTGTLEANLEQLNAHYHLPYVPDLIAQKRMGTEKGTLPDADLAFHAAEYVRLRAALETAHLASPLPDAPPPAVRVALDDLLLLLRLGDPASPGV
jgi:predicted nucleotidyltransferase